MRLLFLPISSKRLGYFVTIAFCLLICSLPLINLALLGVRHLDYRFLLEPSWMKALKNTFIFSVAASLLSLFLGTTSAYAITRTNLPGRHILKSVLLYPYIIPSFLTGIAWSILANPTVGWLKMIFPWINIYTMTGLVFVEALYWYTFAFVNVSNVLNSLDTSLEESARMCGARPLRIFKDITLPLLKPTLVGTAMILALSMVSCFGIPAILGAPGKIFILTTKIYQLVKVGTPEALIQAISVSLPVIALTFSVLYFTEKKILTQSFATLAGKATRRVEVPLGIWKWPLAIFFFGFVFVAIVMPAVTLVIASLRVNYSNWDLSLANYKIILTSAETLQSVVHSLGIAFLCATILAILGFFVAYYKVKTKYRGRNFLTAFASLPYATPGTILALAILFTLTGWYAPLLLGLAYIAKHLSHAIKVVTPAIVNIDKSLEESSLMCGASWFATLRRVWFPLLRGTFSACVFLMMAPIFSEITMSILLTSNDFPTMGTRLFHLQEYESPNQAAVLAVLVLIFVLSANAVVKKLSKGRFGV